MEASKIFNKVNEEILNFSDLLGTVSSTEFETKYWEQEFLHVKRNDPDFYKGLIEVKDLDYLLDLTNLDLPNFRIVSPKGFVGPEKYLNKDQKIDLNKVYSLYADGYSIVLKRLDNHLNSIKKLCNSLKAEISHDVKTNLYYTPKNSIAYTPHIDAHDVIILQIAGTKEWDLYDVIYETPLLDSDTPTLNKEVLQNKKQISMLAGDFMYIPRGVPHNAYTRDDSSMHLTIGIYPVQWKDLIQDAVTQIALQNVHLRKSLPFGYLNQTNKINEEVFHSYLNGLSNNIDFNELILKLENKLRIKKSSFADGHFDSIDAIDSITLNTIVQRRSGVFCEVKRENNKCRILFNGSSMTGPVAIINVFKFISQTSNEFSVEQLPIQKEKHKIQIVQRLIRSGLLKVI